MRFWQALVPFGPGAFSFSGLAMTTDMTIELDLYGILPEWAVYDGLSIKGAGFESGGYSLTGLLSSYVESAAFGLRKEPPP